MFRFHNMEKETLSSAVVEKVSTMYDAFEIVHMFIEEFANLSAHARFGFRRFLVHAASEHNHMELRVLLLERERHSINSLFKSTILGTACTHQMTAEYNSIELLHCEDILYHHEGYEPFFLLMCQ